MDIKDLLHNIDLESNILLEDLPEIDLYMDQVIQLFESKLSSLKRKDEDKILTKTMINNYAKDKLLLPIKNKKYSKEHLILLALIYNLKGGLSIGDIKLSVDNIIDGFQSEESYPIRELYTQFIKKSDEDRNQFIIEINNKVQTIDNVVDESNKLNGDYEKKFLLLCSLVNMSNMYRRASEKLIDEFFSKDDK